MNYESHLSEIVVSREEIKEASKRLRTEIENEYKDVSTPVICLGLLKGCHPFMSDLLKGTNLSHVCDYMDVSSYFGSDKAESEVQIIMDMSTSCKNCDVLIIEDIIDSGRTLKKVIDLLYFRGAKSVKVVTMCDKPSGRSVELNADFVGHVVPDAFLVGYGLDYQEEYRNMDLVGILDKKYINKGE